MILTLKGDVHESQLNNVFLFAFAETYDYRAALSVLKEKCEAYNEEYQEKFDAILCDVLCSGFGTVSENPDIKLFKKEEDFNKGL